MTLKSRGWRLTPLHVAAVASLCTFAAPAFSDESPYTIGVLQTIEHDSNVYRAPDGTTAVSPDWVSTTGVIGSFDQSIGRSTIKGAAEFDINRFRRNKTLDGTSRSEHVDGTWSTIGRLSGEWGLADSAQLYRYNPSSTINPSAVGVRNIETIDKGYAGLHLGVVTPLTFDVTGHVNREKYSAASYQLLNLRRWDAGSGVTYRSTPDLSLSLSFRHTEGKYQSLGDEFSRNDVVFGVFYAPTGLTQFAGQVTEGREKHSLISSRDARNLSASVQWQWQVTGRTQLRSNFEHGDDTNTTGSDLFAGTQLANAEAFRHTAGSLGVYYDVTAKIQASLTGGLSHRKLDSAFSADPTLNERGSDNLYNAGLGLRYKPTRLSMLGCNASREKRTTKGASLGITYPYNSTVISCTGQISFN